MKKEKLSALMVYIYNSISFIYVVIFILILILALNIISGVLSSTRADGD